MNLKDMTVGVVGGGTVGHATARSLVEHVGEVRVFDTVPHRGTTPDLAALIATSELVFVCLPTPADSRGRCDTSVLTDFFRQRAARGETAANYVLKSTVPVGYTRTAAHAYGLTNLVHSPEFLTARTAVADAHLPARNVIGTPNGRPSVCDGMLADLYRKRFPAVPVHVMSSDESEAVKLIQNGFFATKVAYFNEARGLCDKAGLDWNTVLNAVLADGRIAHSHTAVPGPDGLRGFGGACLPSGFTAVTNRGKIPVEDLVESPDLKLLSANAACSETEFKALRTVSSRQYDGDLVDIETPAGTLSCTPDHLLPILRNGAVEVVRAGEIGPTDVLFRVTNHDNQGVSDVRDRTGVRE